MSRRSYLTAVLSLVALTLPVAADASLGWNLRPKDRFWVEWTTLHLQKTRINEQKSAGMEELTVIARFNVLEAKRDGGARLDVQIDMVRGKGVGRAGLPVMLKLEGAVLQLEIDAQSQVVKIEGLEERAGRLTGGAGTEQARAAADVLDKALRAWLEEVFYRLPNREAARGDHWTQKIDAALSGGRTRTRELVYRGAKVYQGRELARVDFTIHTQYPETSDSGTILNRPLRPQVTHEDSHGTLWCNPTTGRPVEASLRVRAENEGEGRLRGVRLEAWSEDEQQSRLRVLDHDPRGETGPTDTRVVLASHRTLVEGLDRERTNSLGMKLVLILPGTFTMGSPDGTPQRTEWEEEHKVEITHFYYMAAHEVTIGQFRAFVEATGYKTDAEKNGGGVGWDRDSEKLERARRFSWARPGWKVTDEHPVVNVSYNDAKAFCAWLSKKEGRSYRLPTEAEWEYACRSGTPTRFACGDDPEGLAKVGNVTDASAHKQFPQWQTIAADDGHVFTAPVGRYRPNSWGLYDMHGNALEWCEDWFWFTGSRPTADPQGPPFGLLRAQRGGSWADFPYQCASARRTGMPPEAYGISSGFRVVADVEEKTEHAGR